MKTQQAWATGGEVKTLTQASAATGSNSYACDAVLVEKIFPLSNATGKTTADCTNAINNGAVYLNGTDVTTQLGNYPGGIVTWKGSVLTDQAPFKTTFGITTSPPTGFVCKHKVAGSPIQVTYTTTNQHLTLPPDYVSRSLEVTAIGGGGGGHGSEGYNHRSNAWGGCSGARSSATLAGAPNAVCTITVGSYGNGGSPGSNQGSDGGASSVICTAGGQVGASGGTRGGGNCIYPSNSNNGSDGGRSPWDSYVANQKSPCDAGEGIERTNHYGGGGQGGMSDKYKCGDHSGGKGAPGVVQISYKQYVWVDFVPTSPTVAPH